MSTVAIPSHDFRLVLRDRTSDSYELSQVLLAVASFDGTLQLLTSGWERMLGYGRAELHGKSLREIVECGERDTPPAVAAILDIGSANPVDLRMRHRNGLAKDFRLHRRYDRDEHLMYVVAEERIGAGG